MKTKIAFLLLMAVTTHLLAQTGNVIEPEFGGDIALLRKGSAIYEALEKVESITISKGGFFDSEQKAVINGLSSKVSVRADEDYEFVMKWPSDQMDPYSAIRVFRLDKDEKTNQRFAMISTGGLAGGYQSGLKLVPIKLEKYGVNFYRFSFLEKPLPGEYAIQNRNKPKVFNVLSINK